MDRIVAERDQAIKDHAPKCREQKSNRTPQNSTTRLPQKVAKVQAERDEWAADRGGPESQPGGGARGEAGGAEQRKRR